MSSIDPLRLAQFMVLPGASELVEAFASIPPGAMRDSVVNMAQNLALQFNGGAASAPIVAAAPRLESPFAENLTAASVEGRVVERLLRGESDHAIAADMGLSLGLVVQLKRNARKLGGVTFPGDDKAAPKAKTSPKAKPQAEPGVRLNKLGRRLPEPFPLPPAPWWWQDPASPIWENRKLLPNFVTGYKGTMASIGPNDSRIFATMEQAAERNGMTLREYVARRQNIVDRVLAGEMPADVAISMRTTGYEVYGLLVDVGHARSKAPGAGKRRKAPAQPAGPETPPARIQRPAARRQSTFPSEHLESIGRAMRWKAAKKWGFANVEAFDDARVVVKNMRMSGIGTLAIAQRTRFPINFVGAAIEFWRKQGVEWPPKLKAA